MVRLEYPCHLTPENDGSVMVIFPDVPEALRETDNRPADLARRLDMDYKSVTRLLDPNHGSRITALERVLVALGKSVTVAISNPVARAPRRQVAAFAEATKAAPRRLA